MSVVDLNVIAENLAHLLTNSTNMASVFYDLFINPTPLDIQLVQLDANGNPVVDPDDNTKPYLTIPNRAKCFQRAKTGDVDPEGEIDGYLGDLYVNETTSTCFVKARGGEYDNTGWEAISDEQGMQEFIEQYLADNTILSEEQLATYLQDHDYTTAADVADAIAHSMGTKIITALSPTSGNVYLEDGRAYEVTTTGNIHLIPPSITDTTKTHSILVQLYKANVSHTVDVGTPNFYNRMGQDFPNVGRYDLRYEYDVHQDGVWVCRAEEKGTSIGTISGLVDNMSAAIVDIGNLQSTVSATEAFVATLSGTVEVISGSVNATATSLNNLTNTVSTISGSVNATATSLNNLTNTVSTISGSVTATANNVTTLSATVATISGSVTATANSLSTLSGTVTTLSGTVNTLSGSITATDNKVATLSGTVSTLSGTVSTLSGTLTSLSNEVSTLSGTVTTVSGSVVNLDQRVTALEQGGGDVHATYDAATETITFSTST